MLPRNFERQLGSDVKREDLFDVVAHVGSNAVLLEINSTYSRVKSLIIGKGGNNIKAIAELCTSIARQEGFRLFDISVVKDRK